MHTLLGSTQPVELARLINSMPSFERSQCHSNVQPLSSRFALFVSHAHIAGSTQHVLTHIDTHLHLVASTLSLGTCLRCSRPTQYSHPVACVRTLVKHASSAFEPTCSSGALWRSKLIHPPYVSSRHMHLTRIYQTFTRLAILNLLVMNDVRLRLRARIFGLSQPFL